MKTQNVKVYPLTPDRWIDLFELFGENGAQGGCWCMWWRSRPKDCKKNAGEGNEYAFKAIVDSHQPVGLLAYIGKEVVGWCSVAPRQQLLRVETSATWRPVDDLPVWAISCFFIGKEHRGRQIAKRLLRHAIGYARKNGAIAIEAYPKDLTLATKRDQDRSLYFGTTKMFEEAGFEEVIRRHPIFPIMRLWFESGVEES
jgi:GNAT superfamily N-acetyltransferase